MSRIEVVATTFTLGKPRQWTPGVGDKPEVLQGYTVTVHPGRLGRSLGRKPRRAWVFVMAQGDLRYVETGRQCPAKWLDAIEQRTVESVAHEDKLIAEGHAEVEKFLTEVVA